MRKFDSPERDSIVLNRRLDSIESTIQYYLIGLFASFRKCSVGFSRCILYLSLVALLTSAKADATKKTEPVELKIETPTFFTDMVVIANITFPEPVESQPEINRAPSDISIVDIEVHTETASIASIRFLPSKDGLITIPALEFHSETTIYRTASQQIMVATPTDSEAMNFTMVAAKDSVYVGEPLRIDITWSADLLTNQIRSLKCYPELFSSPDATIVIPRPTAPEDQQLGLPFGGRRIVAQREASEKAPARLGKITFPIFVKFAQPGEFDIPATRLEIAHLKDTGGALAPYAVFFNNGLFEPRTSLDPFDRYYTESQPLAIKVLPLPAAGQTEAFSGLFAPCTITPSLKSAEISVGDVIEVALRVRSDAPHGMLDLPELGTQRSLRGRYRAGAEYGRTWYPDGTGFSGRIRALTTDITALPSMQFQIFNPEKAAYELIQTKPQPLTVSPRNGKDYYDIRALAPETTLTDQPEGVWHNTQPTKMNDMINYLIGFLAEQFWLLLLLGPITFIILLPRVRESRRRAIDPIYRNQAEAFDDFQELPEQSAGKWEAFLRFLATGFAMPGSAWTAGDGAARLREIGVSKSDVNQVITTHEKMDAADFSSEKPESELPDLNELAQRLFDQFKKAAVILIALWLWLPTSASANDWEQAETLFAKALAAPTGEPATESLFTQSALKYEASATRNNRTGSAWFNAGNAWFKAGEIGRAISCYRQARIYRPFDPSIKDNLAAARALSVDVVEDKRGIELASLPIRWLAAVILIVSWALIAVVLLHLRYRTQTTVAAVIAMLVGLIGLVAIYHSAYRKSESEGVVIVGSTYARKGPAYQYRQAFNEPLHDGLEFSVIEKRDQWLLITLADDRQGWIPATQVRLIKNKRK